MDKDAFEQQKWILDRTVEFARNAEQKASILFGVFAIFFGIFMSSDALTTYLSNGMNESGFVAGFFFVMALAAALVSLVAFIGIVFARLRSPKPSLVFFGSLVNNSPEDVCESLAKGISSEDMAEQILINAKICTLKYKLFNVCAVATPVSIVCAGIFAIAAFV